MDVVIPSTLPAAASAAEPEDHPGRWIGGLVGALTSLTVAGAALAAGWRMPWFDAEFLVWIGLLGVPVGFVLGRAALPTARSGGWVDAIGMGLLIGLAAPPLGAIELVLGGGALGSVSGFSGCDTAPMAAALILLLYAIPFSFIAVVLTVPAGIVWGALVAVLPERWLDRARMPGVVARFGVRHVAAVLAVVVVMVGALQVVAGPSCPT